MNNKELKKGYTTGAHASWAFRSALSVFLEIQEFTVSKTNKMHNDDLDVTKGCEIIVRLSYDKNDLILNSIEHKPYVVNVSNNTLKIYAGEGVGVVTKDGLNPLKNHPAINPKPLEVLSELFLKLTKKYDMPTIYCSIGISDGQDIAKHTANAKVGIVGGLSILGTTGWVKPISAAAYINSITQEINFIKANNISPIVLTIGNSSFEYAKQRYKEEQIVEIGNFVYDTLALCNKVDLKDIVFICGIGKMTKISQGFKNTHNRFGSIGFEKLKDEVAKELNYDIDINSTKTVKGISMQLEKENLDGEFYEYINRNSYNQIRKWFLNLNLKIVLS